MSLISDYKSKVFLFRGLNNLYKEMPDVEEKREKAKEIEKLIKEIEDIYSKLEKQGMLSEAKKGMDKWKR